MYSKVSAVLHEFDAQKKNWLLNVIFGRFFIVFHMWRHMRSSTILPGRCRHCKMAAPINEKKI